MSTHLPEQYAERSRLHVDEMKELSSTNKVILSQIVSTKSTSHLRISYILRKPIFAHFGPTLSAFYTS